MTKTWRSLPAALGIAAALCGAAAAEPVRLTSLDSGFVLAGDLLSFDGQSYVIRSSIGELTVSAYSVRCDGPGCPARETTPVLSSFGVIGSNTIGSALMPELIESYLETTNGTVERVIGASASQLIMKLKDEAGREVAEIDLRARGSSDAFPSLISGDATIGMSSRPVSEAEYAALESAGIRDITRAGNEHVLALDGLIAIVARNNPVSKIAVDDLALIFAGEITNWGELGGPDTPIRLVMREPGSGSFDTFVNLVLTPAGYQMSPGVEYISSAARLSDTVAGDPTAIGVTGVAFERNARALPLETSCGLVIEPSEFNVKTEEYPLSRRLYLYTTGAPLPNSARGILEYSLSDEAQDLIADIGFVDQSISEIDLNEQGRRIVEAFLEPRDPERLRTMRDLALELLDAKRLSTTVRFQQNSSVLDVKSLGDIGRLARVLSEGDYDGQEILLIGFADDAPRFESNLALSTQRARQIRAGLLAELDRIGARQADFDILELGYGDLAPVGCGDEAVGGVSNRRVEVWVRERI